MKKYLHQIMTMFIGMMTVMMFTSCEDDEIARTLEGTWSGNMEIEMQDRYGSYIRVARTEVTFLRDVYTFSSGEGYWVDYFEGRTYRDCYYIASRISWTVNLGTIDIQFLDDEYETRMRIRRYDLTDECFSGEIQEINNEGESRWREFRLYYKSSPVRNYRDYGRPYYYNENYGYTRSSEAANDSLPMLRRVIR